MPYLSSLPPLGKFAGRRKKEVQNIEVKTTPYLLSIYGQVLLGRTLFCVLLVKNSFWLALLFNQLNQLSKPFKELQPLFQPQKPEVYLETSAKKLVWVETVEIRCLGCFNLWNMRSRSKSTRI